MKIKMFSDQIKAGWIIIVLILLALLAACVPTSTSSACSSSGSGHISLDLVESWNIPNNPTGDPLWNLCRPEVETMLFVHGYVPPLLPEAGFPCPDSASSYWPLLDWFQIAYPVPAKTYSVFDWCMNSNAFNVITNLANTIQLSCQNNCVIISHSTGGMYVTAALGKLIEDGWDDVDHVIGHIALSSAQGGRKDLSPSVSYACTSFGDMDVCEALNAARENTRLVDWRQLGATNFRHRYLITKSPDVDHDGALPTHSVCGVSDAQMPNTDKQRNLCSDFHTNTTSPTQYFGHADSSYELYQCDYGDFNCHGVLPGNHGNIACQIFWGYTGWGDDCSVATINAAQTDIAVIYDMFSDNEVEVTVSFTNNSATELNFDAQLHTNNGDWVATQPVGVWQSVPSGATVELPILSSNGHFLSLQDFGDNAVVKLREQYTSLSGASVWVDTLTIPIPEPGGEIVSVTTECIPVPLAPWADEDFVAEVEFKNDGGAPGKYKVFLESENGDQIDVEHDEFWTDLLPDQSITIQVGTNLNPNWSIKDVDGNYTIILKEQDNNVMDTSFSSNGASCN